MKKHSKIYIAGHSGMVGSALQRKLNIVVKELEDLDGSKLKSLGWQARSELSEGKIWE